METDSQVKLNKALISAAEKGNVSDVLDLLKQGADIKAKSYGMNALQFASWNGHTDTVLALLKSAIKNPNESLSNTDLSGGEALLFASTQGHVETVQVLLDYGDNVETQNHAGSTSLMMAAMHGHVVVVNLLLKQGVEYDTKNNQGWTALMYGIKAKNIETVLALLERGVDITIKNNDGHSALMLANKYNMADMVGILESFTEKQQLLTVMPVNILEKQQNGQSLHF